MSRRIRAPLGGFRHLFVAAIVVGLLCPELGFAKKLHAHAKGHGPGIHVGKATASSAPRTGALPDAGPDGHAGKGHTAGTTTQAGSDGPPRMGPETGPADNKTAGKTTATTPANAPADSGAAAGTGTRGGPGSGAASGDTHASAGQPGPASAPAPAKGEGAAGHIDLVTPDDGYGMHHHGDRKARRDDSPKTIAPGTRRPGPVAHLPSQTKSLPQRNAIGARVDPPVSAAGDPPPSARATRDAPAGSTGASTPNTPTAAPGTQSSGAMSSAMRPAADPPGSAHAPSSSAASVQAPGMGAHVFAGKAAGVINGTGVTARRWNAAVIAGAAGGGAVISGTTVGARR